MDFEKLSLKQSAGKEYIYLKALENPKTENIYAAAEAILKLKKKHNCSLVLMDTLDSKSMPSVVRLFMLGTKILQLKGIRELKTAVVTNEITTPGARFFSDFANNRGYNFKTFTDIKSAENWLIF